MDVPDSLTTVGSGVEHDSVSGSGYAFCLGNRGNIGKEPSCQRRVGAGQRSRILVVRAGHDKDMYWCLRGYIAEGNGVSCFGHDGGRNVAGDNRTEQAVRHGLIVDGVHAGSGPTRRSG